MSARDYNVGAVQRIAVDSKRDAVCEFLLTPSAVAFFCRQCRSPYSCVRRVFCKARLPVITQVSKRSFSILPKQVIAERTDRPSQTL